MMLQAIKDQRGAHEYILLLQYLSLHLDEDIHPHRRKLFKDDHLYDSDGNSRIAMYESAVFLLQEGLRKSLKGEVLNDGHKDILKDILGIKRN